MLEILVEICLAAEAAQAGQGQTVKAPIDAARYEDTRTMSA